MTSFDPLHPKTAAIIELLAEHPSLSARELFARLRKEKQIKQSIANFYKLLGKMIDHQMLVKTGENVSLNMVWATHIHNYALKMQKHAGATDASFPPFKEGERRMFHGESLEKIDPIWTHLVLYLFSQEPDPEMFVYESHPWYILGRPATERRMYESCRMQGKKMHILYGNTSFLDRYAHALHKNSPYDVHMTDNPPFPKEGYNLWLCGPYIIECVFPSLIAQHFAHFFKTTSSIEEFDLNTFSGIFHINIPAELHVSRDRKKAEKLRKIFLRAVAAVS